MKNNNSLLMESLGIPNFTNINEFSDLIGFSTTLLYCLSINKEKYYSIKNVPKKDGSKRTIYIPSGTLKIVQKWILVNILNKIKPTKAAMAFRKNDKNNVYNIKQNAYYHANSLYGLTVDLKDFFSSIKSNKVYNVFRNIGYNNFASTILTNLCTYDNFLPQGGICSPALSNLIAINLDNRMLGLCEKRNILYTRYADDMYFSCDNKILLLRFYPVIEKIIGYEDFLINKNKVHYQTRKNKRIITGVTVDYNGTVPQLKASRELKKIIRAEIFRCIISGDYSNVNHIKGEIAFVCYIEGESYFNNIKKYISKSANKIRYYPELVKAYNDNKFYKGMDSVETISIDSVDVGVDKDDKELYYEVLADYLISMYEERECYLKKHSISDICSYDGWPIDK